MPRFTSVLLALLQPLGFPMQDHFREFKVSDAAISDPHFEQRLFNLIVELQRDSERQSDIGQAFLQQQQQPAQFAAQKPVFITQITQAEASTLSSIIGPDSRLLFHLLGIDHTWMTLPPGQWCDSRHCTEMSAVV